MGRGGGLYAIKSVHSGKCMEVGGWSKQAGGKIIQWDCHYGKNQLWEVRTAGSNLRFKNAHSGMYLDVPSNLNWNNLQLQQWHYLSWSRAQDFRPAYR